MSLPSAFYRREGNEICLFAQIAEVNLMKQANFAPSVVHQLWRLTNDLSIHFSLKRLRKKHHEKNTAHHRWIACITVRVCWCSIVFNGRQ